MKNGVFMAIVLAVWGFLKLVFKLLKSVIQVLSSLIVYLGLYIPLFYFVFGIILLATTSFSFNGTGTDQLLYYIGFALSCVAAAIITIRNLLIRPLSSVFAAFKREGESTRASDDPRGRRFSRSRAEIEGNDGRTAEFARRDGARFYRDCAPVGISSADHSLSSDYAVGAPSDPRFEHYPPLGPDYRSGADPRFQYDIPARYDPRSPSDPRSDLVSGEVNYRGGYSSALRGEYSRSPAYEAPYRLSSASGTDGGSRPTDSICRQFGEIGERPLVYYSKRRPGVLVKEYADRFELFEDGANGARYLGTEYKED